MTAGLAALTLGALTPRGAAAQSDAAPDDGRGPLGRQVGAFDVQASLTTSYTYDSNVLARPDATADDIYALQPRASATTGNDRVTLTLAGGGELRRYGSFEELNVEGYTLSGTLVGIGPRLTYDASLNASERPARFGTPENDADSARRLQISRRGGRAGARLRITDGFVGGRVSVNRTTFDADEPDEAALAPQVAAGQGFRDNTFGRVDVEAGRNLTEAISIVAEAEVARFAYDEEAGDLFDRDALLTAYRGGVRYLVTDLIEASATLGYRDFQPEDDALEEVSGLSYAASVVWRPSPLTTVTLAADQDFVSSAFVDVNAVATDRLDLSVRHSPARGLDADAAITISREDYEGIDARTETLVLRGGLSYALRRNSEIGVSVRYADRTGAEGVQALGGYQDLEVGATFAFRL